jgi:neutral amino acid transport system permease protein
VDFTAIFASALRAAFGPAAAAYALMAVGLNIHFGYTGLLNFGQVGFMLLGAYGVAISVSVFGLNLWAGVLLSIAFAVALALLLGLPTLRLRADYLAITTIAAAEILRFVFRASPMNELTGSVYGLRGFSGQFNALNPYTGGISFGLFTYNARQLWVMTVGWGLVALATLFVFALSRSPWGRVLKAIREDEDAARALGKNVFNYKMQSLVLGGVIGALGGVVFAFHLQSVHPDTFLPLLTFYFYTILILGGAATVLGPVIGSILFFFLLNSMDLMVRSASRAGYLPQMGSEAEGAIRFLIVGIGLMLLMIYRPQGIFGDRRELQLDVQ